ncbi:MAG TPA: ABC transporter permease [Bryobacteraceae bacterium]
MDALWKELRLAGRTLGKTPAFTAVAIATLALGIGVNTAIFTVVNQFLLNPAGIAHPDQIVVERVRYDKLAMKSISVSVPDFADVQKSTDTFASAAIMGQGDFSYTGSGVPERLRGASVTYRWFEVFGASPRLGRVFQSEEDTPDGNHVVVLAYAAWKRLFGEDASVVGKTIELNQQPYKIIGVMNRDFRWPATTDIWVPLGLAPAQYNPQNRFNESYTAVARLRSGVFFDRANAFMTVLSDRVCNDGTRAGAYAKDSAWGMFVLSFTDFVAGETKTPMLVLLGAVGFVLLIACSNIAGLMLARSSGRAREIAVRAALGAGRWDLIRQTLAESALLSTAGALAGLGIAVLGVRALLQLAPADIPVPLSVRIDGTVLAFTALAAIVAGILFGIAPAWQISRMDRFESLKEGGRSGMAGMRRQKLRSVLVMAEVALALMLLVGAGLFLRSLAALEQVSPGFQPGGVITASVSLPRSRYPDAPRRAAFYRAVLDRLATLPGATAAGAATSVPFSGMGGSASFQIEGRPSPPGDPGPHGDIALVSPSYFAALKIPIRSGRVFTDQDQPTTDRVALVDETLAKQYWPGENPIGKHMKNGGPNTPWATIVGVVGHVKNSDLAGDTVKGRYYYPMFQNPLPFATFVVRTQGDPGGLGNGIRQAVQGVDGSQPVANIRTMVDMVSESLLPKRFVVAMLGVFAGMALLMAILGLYGVISYSVTQRTQEIGIRLALGAQRSEILSLVIGQGMRLAAIGAAGGLVISLAVSRLLRSELFEVSPFDPLTFTATALVLIGAALAASYVPARRATRTDPIDALRYE